MLGYHTRIYLCVALEELILYLAGNIHYVNWILSVKGLCSIYAWIRELIEEIIKQVQNTSLKRPEQSKQIFVVSIGVEYTVQYFYFPELLSCFMLIPSVPQSQQTSRWYAAQNCPPFSNTRLTHSNDTKYNIMPASPVHWRLSTPARNNICMYVCAYVCLYECMHVCLYACMYACMHVRTVDMHACIYVCTCITLKPGAQACL